MDQDVMLAYHEITPGKPFSLPQVAGLRFTPIEVARGNVRGSVIFLADFANRKKCLFLWDIDHPGAARLTDEKPNLEIIVEYKDLLQNPDILFLETNGWKVNSPGHGSLIDAQPYLDIINPRQVILLHLSGHSDMPDKPAFGWSDVQWQQNIYRNPLYINHALIAGNQGDDNSPVMLHYSLLK
ncbi:hypothetical protein GF337_00580 [candidate division KSB1 bacterium]|nr:hypothetical protein [candidate division KSB1 bacterium]